MSDHHFPDFTDHSEWTVKLIFKLALEDETYLTDKTCPYSTGFKTIIASAVKGLSTNAEVKQPEVPVGPITEDMIDSNLDVDLYQVFSDLKTYGKTISQSDQTERMAYFRTATSLLERLVTARERALGIKQIRDFQDTVLTIMEETMNPDQRTRVMDRLRSTLARQAIDEGQAQPTTEEKVQ
jgi:hypothetical protein